MTTIFVCEDSLDGILTGVYEAWDSRLGHEKPPVSNCEAGGFLFSALLVGFRQVHGERGAFPRRALQVNDAASTVDGMAHERKPLGSCRLSEGAVCRGCAGGGVHAVTVTSFAPLSPFCRRRPRLVWPDSRYGQIRAPPPLLM